MNLRPSGYEPDELPGCSTPRHQCVPCTRSCEARLLSALRMMLGVSRTGGGRRQHGPYSRFGRDVNPLSVRRERRIAGPHGFAHASQKAILCQRLDIRLLVCHRWQPMQPGVGRRGLRGQRRGLRIACVAYPKLRATRVPTGCAAPGCGCDGVGAVPPLARRCSVQPVFAPLRRRPRAGRSHRPCGGWRRFRRG